VGGESGKNWSTCVKQPGATDCYSYSNDASLLLPSTAMTAPTVSWLAGVLAASGRSVHRQIDPSGPLQANMPPYFLVTGTADGTKVEVKLGPNGQGRRG